MHALDSITRAHANREGFDANWSDLVQETWEKDWKRFLTNQILKSIMAWDFVQSFWPNMLYTYTASQP